MSQTEAEAPPNFDDLIAAIRFSNGCGRQRCANLESPNCACSREIAELYDPAVTEGHQ